MESLPEARVHRTPETAVVPPAGQLGVDTEGDQRKGDREQGRSTKTQGQVGWNPWSRPAEQGLGQGDRRDLAWLGPGGQTF